MILSAEDDESLATRAFYLPLLLNTISPFIYTGHQRHRRDWREIFIDSG